MIKWLALKAPGGRMANCTIFPVPQFWHVVCIAKYLGYSYEEDREKLMVVLHVFLSTFCSRIFKALKKIFTKNMSKIQTPWKSVLLSPDNSSNSYQIGQQSINWELGCISVFWMLCTEDFWNRRCNSSANWSIYATFIFRTMEKILAGIVPVFLQIVERQNVCRVRWLIVAVWGKCFIKVCFFPNKICFRL